MFSMYADESTFDRLKESISGMDIKNNLNKFIKSLPENHVVKAEADRAGILGRFESLVAQIDKLFKYFTSEATSASLVSNETLKIYNAWVVEPLNRQDAVYIFNQITKMRAIHNNLHRNFTANVNVNFKIYKFQFEKLQLFTDALRKTTDIKKLQATQKQIRTVFLGIKNAQNQIKTKLRYAETDLTDFCTGRELFAWTLMGDKIDLNI